MSLKPEMSLGASLATMALVYGIYDLNLPTMANIKASAPHNAQVNSSLKAADWTAIGACAALSLLAHDSNIFIFGGGFAVALHWYFTHSNMTHPASGQVTMPPAAGSSQAGS